MIIIMTSSAINVNYFTLNCQCVKACVEYDYIVIIKWKISLSFSDVLAGTKFEYLADSNNIKWIFCDQFFSLFWATYWPF